MLGIVLGMRYTCVTIGLLGNLHGLLPSLPTGAMTGKEAAHRSSLLNHSR